MRLKSLLVVTLFVVASNSITVAAGKDHRKDYKYSKEANQKPQNSKKSPGPVTGDYRKKVDRTRGSIDSQGSFGDEPNYKLPKNYSTTTERLFRMQKIQNIWNKGQKVSCYEILTKTFCMVSTAHLQHLQLSFVGPERG